MEAGEFAIIVNGRKIPPPPKVVEGEGDWEPASAQVEEGCTVITACSCNC